MGREKKVPGREKRTRRKAGGVLPGKRGGPKSVNGSKNTSRVRTQKIKNGRPSKEKDSAVRAKRGGTCQKRTVIVRIGKMPTLGLSPLLQKTGWKQALETEEWNGFKRSKEPPSFVRTR